MNQSKIVSFLKVIFGQVMIDKIISMNFYDQFIIYNELVLLNEVIYRIRYHPYRSKLFCCKIFLLIILYAVELSVLINVYWLLMVQFFLNFRNLLRTMNREIHSRCTCEVFVCDTTVTLIKCCCSNQCRLKIKVKKDTYVDLAQ